MWSTTWRPVVLFALFPDGVWRPRWSRWVVGIVGGWALTLEVTPLGDALAAGRDPVTPIDAVVFIGSLVAIVWWQVARFRSSDPSARTQCRWVVAALGLALATFVPVVVAVNIDAGIDPRVHLVALVAVVAAMYVVVFVLAAALLRHQLWNLDVVVNRLLVFGGLSAVILAVYVAVVALVSGPVRGYGNLAAAGAATVVACGLEPLRRQLQRRADHLVYGSREIGPTIAAALHVANIADHPRDVLDDTAARIAALARLPRVAIDVSLADGTTLSGSAGDALTEGGIVAPITLDGAIVGSLAASP